MSEDIVLTMVGDAETVRANPELMRKVVEVIALGYDGRPDAWTSLGQARATCERLILAEMAEVPVGLAWGYRQPDQIAVTRDRPNPYYDGIEQLEKSTAGTWFLSSFAVRPECRRLGVGGRLLAAAEEAAMECGARIISLIVPLPDAPEPRPNPPVKGYDVPVERRADTVPFLARRRYVKRMARSGFYSLGIPVTNQLMTKELADG